LLSVLLQLLFLAAAVVVTVFVFVLIVLEVPLNIKGGVVGTNTVVDLVPVVVPDLGLVVSVSVSVTVSVIVSVSIALFVIRRMGVILFGNNFQQD